MGRTLHFNIKKEESNFTEKEYKAMYDVSSQLNSGKFKNIWSCENFWFAPYDNNEKREIHSFCKTQGNEMNSHLVIVGLVEISKRIPSAVIEVSDEGELLICKLRIQNGKALPVISDIKENLESYAFRMFMSDKNKLKKLELKANDFCKEFAQDLYFNNGYGDMTNYFNRELKKLHEIQKIMQDNWKRPNTALYFFNIENCPAEYWLDPFLFCRPVKVSDFLTYKCSPATLMAGFNGEYWNMNNGKDAESESYKTIARIQELFSKTGAKMKILGEE